jgi:hypothetical protein
MTIASLSVGGVRVAIPLWGSRRRIVSNQDLAALALRRAHYVRMPSLMAHMPSAENRFSF